MQTQEIELEQPEVPAIADPWLLEVDEQIKVATAKSIQAVPMLLLTPAKSQVKPQQTFIEYSPTKLRKIAKNLKIKRYSVMPPNELIAAISKHPKAQEFLTA